MPLDLWNRVQPIVQERGLWQLGKPSTLKAIEKRANELALLTNPGCAIFRHFQACRQGSPRVAKGFQGPRGTPGMGEMSYNKIDHI